MGLFLLLTGVVFTLFGFNTESAVKILGTGELLFGSYFNSSISGVIFTPEKEFFVVRVKITPPKNNST